MCVLLHTVCSFISHHLKNKTRPQFLTLVGTGGTRTCIHLHMNWQLHCSVCGTTRLESRGHLSMFETAILQSHPVLFPKVHYARDALVWPWSTRNLGQPISCLADYYTYTVCNAWVVFPKQMLITCPINLLLPPVCPSVTQWPVARQHKSGDLV